jgi:poly(hydroxyalkanoate) depolymerase family esterase
MKFFLLIFFTLIASNITLATELKKFELNTITGLRNYYLYLPKLEANNNKFSMIVMLHGCEENAIDFANSTHILKYAEKNHFAVLLPEQDKIYNPYKCWNWIIPANNTRAGEGLIIVEMIEEVLKNNSIDKKKIFAAGMSAGGSMAQILGNCFPDVVKAIASHDGVQYYSTYTGLDFQTVVLNGATVSPEVAGETGYLCSALFNPPKQMPIIIFQGMASPLMNPIHAFQIEDEFKIFNDYLDNGFRDNSIIKNKKIENIPDGENYGYTLYSLYDKNNNIFIERYMINQLSHAWSGGDAKYPYNDPKGPNATQLIINFFKRFGL